MKISVLFVAVAALLGACSGNDKTAPATTATPAATAPADAPGVEALNQQFISAWNGKDAEKAAALLADDVQFLQGRTHFSGKNEVAEKWIKASIGTIGDLKTNVVSSGTEAELAYESGTFSADVLPTATEPAHGIGEGNFTLLWKKAGDGHWKLSLAQLEDLPVQVRR